MADFAIVSITFLGLHDVVALALALSSTLALREALLAARQGAGGQHGSIAKGMAPTARCIDGSISVRLGRQH